MWTVMIKNFGWVCFVQRAPVRLHLRYSSSIKRESGKRTLLIPLTTWTGPRGKPVRCYLCNKPNHRLTDGKKENNSSKRCNVSVNAKIIRLPCSHRSTFNISHREDISTSCCALNMGTLHHWWTPTLSHCAGVSVQKKCRNPTDDMFEETQ